MNRAAGFVLLGVGVAGLAGAALHMSAGRRRQRALAGVLGQLSEATSGPQRNKRSGATKATAHTMARMSIDERVGILRDLGHRALSPKSPDYAAMRKLALEITAGCRARDGMCEAKAIDAWIRKNIRYTGDVGPHYHGRNGPREGIDVFQAPSRTVEFRGGDCDDHALLACHLLIQNGFACTYRVTGPSRANNDDWGHIYAMAGVPKTMPRRLVALDTTLPGRNMFGREAPYGKKRDFEA